eukprot:6187654-Pleurochrysis_carterae.AAC.1
MIFVLATYMHASSQMKLRKCGPDSGFYAFNLVMCIPPYYSIVATLCGCKKKSASPSVLFFHMLTCHTILKVGCFFAAVDEQTQLKASKRENCFSGIDISDGTSTPHQFLEVHKTETIACASRTRGVE